MFSQIEFDVVIKKRGKRFIASCPSIGTKGAGRTRDEAIEELKDQTWNFLIGSVTSRNYNN